MSLFRPKVELLVIRDSLNPTESMEYYSGRKLEDLVKQAFESGISDSVRFYHNSLTKEVFGLDERKNKQAIKAFCSLKGRVYAQVVPMGLTAAALWTIAGSVAVSLAATFLFAPKPPEMGTPTQPPSPNNSLASRSNKERLGGRVPDIFGEVWSVPDLIAPTYSVYIDNRETEYSYMCVGRGKYEVKKALDDTTPINQVFGSSALIYDPDTNLNDEPAFLFGEQFNPNEAEFSRLAAKRYTSVNGQVLPAPDEYTTDAFIFKAPNIIETTANINLADVFSVDETLLIENASNLESANGITDADGNLVTYTLDGSYTIESVTEKTITISNLNNEWQKLSDNADLTVEKDNITLSQEAKTLWQGHYYTSDKDHDKIFVNVFSNALWVSQPSGKWEGLKLFGAVESEIVDSAGNPIAGTLHTQTFEIASPNFDKHINGEGDVRNGGAPTGSIRTTYETKDEVLRQSTGITIRVDNPHYTKGKLLRFRIARTSRMHVDNDSTVYQEIKVKDFYSARVMTADDMPSGVTTVYSKTLATEGALSLKERKLRLLVERYVKDFYTKELKLSKRADDIIYHIATDPKIGNLTDDQIDFEQIKSEVDAIVAYFGSEKFAQFCYTFDSDNLSSEESIQEVAWAVFSNAKRYGNKLMLDFEREVPASLAVFNSHNILPDTYSESQSFGVLNDYDGAKVEYTDPSDDAKVTKSYPHDALTNPHTKELIGVRNELQATAHMMRIYNKDRFTYKSCEFTAGDESNTVTRTNRVTVVSQADARTQQGTVDGIEVIDSDIVLHTTDPVALSSDAYLFIQTINNGVESIRCSPRDDYSVTLARLPQGEISTDWQNAVRAVYQIASSSDGDRDSYIITEKDPAEAMTNKLTCTNYSSKFYQNDKDYLKSLT